jgi:hypothetical protein
MIDLNKKYWREKVTAEITLAHVMQFAQELGSTLNAAELAVFLNDSGRAQAMWMHMMQAGEEYIKTSLLEGKQGGLHKQKRPATPAATNHSLQHKPLVTPEPASISYQ